MNELISYETIRNVQRKEKEEKILQKLPENFFILVREWLRNKKDSIKDNTDMIELENAKNLLEDIINRRETKIIMSALNTMRGNLPSDGLSEEEVKFFDNIISLLKKFKSEMQEEILGYDGVIESKINSAREAVSATLKKVKFVADVPKFVDENMKKYGPFTAGDETEVPASVAEMLAKRNSIEV